MSEEISKILEDVEKHCSGSTKFSSYIPYSDTVRDIVVNNSADYTLFCKLLSYGFIRFATLDSNTAREKLQKQANGKLILPKEIELFVQCVLGLNATVEDCAKVMNLENGVEFREAIDLNSSDNFKFIMQSFTTLLYYNYDAELIATKETFANIFFEKYNLLVEVVKHNMLTEPYGVLYQNKKGKMGYSLPFFLELNEETGELDKHSVKIITNIVPPVITRESLIAKVLLYYFNTTEGDEFFYKKDENSRPKLYKNDSGALVNFPTKVEDNSKVLLYPIFIASLIYRRPMSYKDGKWCLDTCKKMNINDYLNWLRPFFMGELADMLLKGIMLKHSGERIDSTLVDKYLKNIVSYAYLQDFSGEGVSRGILEFYFGEYSTNIKPRYEAIKSQFQEGDLLNQLYSGQKMTKLVHSEAFGISINEIAGYTLVFTGDEKGYNGLTSFAYKTYALAAANGQKPTAKNVFLGVDAANKLKMVDLSHTMNWGIYISAGSRSGKGVLTLNILAGLLGSGNYLMYLDNKPEMAYTFWQLERMLNAKNGQTVDFDEATQTYNPDYKRILSLECTVMGYTFKDDKNNVIGRNSTRVKRAHEKGIKGIPEYFKDVTQWGALAYAKAMQLLMIFASMPDLFGIKGKYVIGVCDELAVASRALSDFIDKVGACISVSIKGSVLSYDMPKKSEEEHNIAKVYIDFLNSIARAFKNGKDAFLTKKNTVKLIGIAQKLLGTSNMQGDVPKSCSYLAAFIDYCPLAIYGKNGNIFWGRTADGKYFAVDKTNDKDRQDLANYVGGVVDLKDMASNEKLTVSSESVSRAFILQESTGNRGTASAFKPLFALNENDFEIATQQRYDDAIQRGDYTSPVNEAYLDTVINEFHDAENILGDSAVAGFLNVTKSNYSDDRSFKNFIKQEILIQDGNGEYRLNEAIGFIGLLKQVSKSVGQSSDNLLDNLSYLYRCSEQLLRNVGLWNDEKYQCVEDYIYDCNPESFMNTDVLMAKLTGLGAINLMDNAVNVNMIDIENPISDDMSFFEQPVNVANQNSDTSQENVQMSELEFEKFNPFNSYQQMMNDTTQPQFQPQPQSINNTTNGTNEQGFRGNNEQQDFDDTEQTSPNPLYNETGGNGQPQQRIVIDKQTGQSKVQIFDEQSQQWVDMPSTQSNQSNQPNQPTQPTQPNPVQQDIEQYQGPQYTEPLFERIDRAEDMPNMGTYQGVLNVSALLLEIIQQTIGDLDRIHSFEIDERGRIFVNEVLIAPTLTDEQLKAVPLDIRGKIKNGCWGYVFIYKKLSMYKRLVKLRIDDKNIAFRIVKYEFGVKNDWLKIKKWFSFRRVKLQELIICGQEIKEPEVQEDGTIIQSNSNSYQQIEQEEERMSLIDRCKEGFSNIGEGIRGFEDTCTKVGSSTIWNSKPVKFARAVGGAGLAVGAVALLGSMFGLLGAGAGIYGIYRSAFGGKKKQ